MEEHFLRPAQVRAVFELPNKATNVQLAASGAGSLTSASEMEEHICELRDHTTADLNECVKEYPGLTPLLERALHVIVGFGWDEVLDGLCDVQARQRHCKLNTTRLLRCTVDQADRRSGLSATLHQDTTEDADIHAAAVIRERMRAHTSSSSDSRVLSVGRVAGAMTARQGTANASQGPGRRLLPAAAVKASKAAREYSKTGVVNFLLATSPPLSTRVQIASGAAGAWGANMPGLFTPAAGRGKGRGKTGGQGGNQKNAKKKKKAKDKKTLQGLAMKR